MHVRPVSILLLLFASASAHADPAFMTLDRYDGTTKAGTSLTWLNVDAAGEGGARFETYGQYLLPNGLGGYAAGSYTRYTFDDAETTWTAGNSEVGGLWANPNIPFRTVLRAGVVLATAGDGIDDDFANVRATYPRHTDISHVTGAVTWSRVFDNVEPLSVAVDLAGNIAVGGESKDLVDFGGGNIGEIGDREDPWMARYSSMDVK